jgi:carboxyl-terminal processing protease
MMNKVPPQLEATHRPSQTLTPVRRVATSTLMVVLLLGGFVAGNFTGYMARPALAQEAEQPSEFAIFWEAWSLVNNYFVDQDKIDFRQMTYGAIQGMLNSLGDENHTVFFSPEVAERQQSMLDGSFEGIGAYVSSEDGIFTIIAPIFGSPAEEAGLLAGDIVLAVDGIDVTGKEQFEVISMIRGPSGTPVTLTVLRPDSGAQLELTIVRGRINIDSVLWSRIPGSEFAYVQITQFAGDTSSELRTALQEILEEERPVAGIVLDLRNNPGGYLQEALRVASQFLPEGDVILHEKDARGEITTYRSQGAGLAREMRLVVLVNPGSASAAEILAGSLQENGRAKVIGEATVGTGTVLRPFTLSDGSVVRLGVTNWLTPGLHLIKGEGIQPDVVIKQDATVELVNSLNLKEFNEREARIHPDRQFQTALLLLQVHTRNSVTVRENGVPAP